jgi:hypothetical protein
MNPLELLQKRNALTPVRKALIQAADVGDVIPVRGTQDVERSEAGASKRFVEHGAILERLVDG